MNYKEFLNNLDKRLENYFEQHKEYINCHKGCSFCCEKGDYPISNVELEYLMQGFIQLSDENKIKVQQNIKNIKKGEICPFLINKKCSVYDYRPIICRVHGLAYLCQKSTVKTPYCVKYGKNYANVYNNGQITINPIKENLDTVKLLQNFEGIEIRNLIDWIKLD